MEFLGERNSDAGLLEKKLYSYIQLQQENEVPPILNLGHFSALMGVDPIYLNRIIYDPDRYYRKFDIPKRSGGVRTISIPSATVLHCQRYIAEEILAKIPLNEAAHGFVRNKSILTNAAPHLAANSLLKIDIKEFFPSIGFSRVMAVFQNMGYPPKISYYLSRVCCINDSLPQGGATSPALSNIICKRLDRRLSGFADRFGLAYTRYADDLTFSAPHISTGKIDLVYNILKDEGFTPNFKKTRLIRGNGKKIVTGISVVHRLPKLPRQTVRNIKQSIFVLLKKGYEDFSSLADTGDPIVLERLEGQLRFWIQVDPENRTPKELAIKLRQFKKMFDEFLSLNIV